MRKIVKFTSILLLISIIIFLFISLFHTHTDKIDQDNCILCMIINRVTDNLNSYTPINNLIIILLIFFIRNINLHIKNIYSRKEKTLIGLKVELNN